MAAVPFVSVVCTDLRRFEPLLKTVEDLLDQDYPAFEVVVVDQNVSWPEACEARRTTIRSDARIKWLVVKQVGVVAARNAGVEASTGDLLLFVDDDVFVPSPRLIANHARRYADPSVVAIVGRERQVGESSPEPKSADAPVPALPPPANLSPLEQTMAFDRNGDRAQQVCTFCTCNSSIRRSAFLDVGGFDERFTGNSYGDDYDLALRLYGPDRVTIYEPDAWLVHRREPVGGLRMTDGGNAFDRVQAVQCFWLFVLRHGYRGVYWDLIYRYVLRRTVLLKKNLLRPWMQPLVIVEVVLAFTRARAAVQQGPRSRFVAAATESL